MGDRLVPAPVLRNLSDKLYEKRKSAAHEIEGIVKSFSVAYRNEDIRSIILLIIHEYVQSPQVTQRQGGLFALAGIAVGLKHDLTHFNVHYLNMIISPVLNALVDQDSRVRYSACESLYNIAKVSREDLCYFFDRIFDALCNLSADTDADVKRAVKHLNEFVKDVAQQSEQFSVERLIPVLKDRMKVPNPLVRRFLVDWIIALDGLPHVDMLPYLPDYLDGLFDMLSDTDYEIRQQADTALNEFLNELKENPAAVNYELVTKILVDKTKSSNEFTRLTALLWILSVVQVCEDHMTRYLEEILEAVLFAMSDKEEKIMIVAQETNTYLHREVVCNTLADMASLLRGAQRGFRSSLVTTKFEALKWILTLLERHRTEVLSFLDELFPSLLQALSDDSEEVALEVLKIQACVAQDAKQFRMLIVFLLAKFQADRSLFERRASLVLRNLCVFLGAEIVYKEISSVLQKEADLEFAAIMVQALNMILLTSKELEGLRTFLRQSLIVPEARDCFMALYASWCHSAVATVSLCLLAEAYDHAFAVIQSLGEADINVKFYVQLDKLVQLLDTPAFTTLRLQLLDPERSQSPVKPLYGMLMILPQRSVGFKLLQQRLKSVPPYALQPGLMQQRQYTFHQHIDFGKKLKEFEMMQEQHRIYRQELESSTSASTLQVMEPSTFNSG